MTTAVPSPEEQLDDVPPTVDKLLEVLELERIDRDLFRAWNPHREGHRGTLFGGQVAAHAVRAATLTVDVEHHPHSLHGYFLRPGKNGAPTILRVDRIRDGRSFTTRNVVALQDGEAIFTASVSFHKDEPGGEFQVPRALDVPTPSDLVRQGHEPRDFWGEESPFQRLEIPREHLEEDDPRRAMWVRTRGSLPDDRGLHACVTTFISDMGPVGVVRNTLGQWNRQGMGASLDHTVWFHRPIRPDHWLLFDLQPMSTAGARGLVVGTLHTEDGRLGASIAQEGLVRILDS